MRLHVAVLVLTLYGAGSPGAHAQESGPPPPPVPYLPPPLQPPPTRDGRWLRLTVGNDPTVWVDTERKEGIDPTGTRHRAWVRMVYATPQVQDLWRGKKAYTFVSRMEFDCHELLLTDLNLTVYDSSGAVVYDGNTDRKPKTPPPNSRGERMLTRFCEAVASGEIAGRAQ